jgi:hypothetical protein
MGVNGQERAGARNGLQQLHGGSSPHLTVGGGGEHYQKNAHRSGGGGGVVYGDGSWDLSVFVTDLQVYFLFFNLCTVNLPCKLFCVT